MYFETDIYIVHLVSTRTRAWGGGWGGGAGGPGAAGAAATR